MKETEKMQEPIVRTDLHLFVGRRDICRDCDIIVARSLEEAILEIIEFNDRLLEGSPERYINARFLPDQTKPIEDYFHLLNLDSIYTYNISIRDFSNMDVGNICAVKRNQEYGIYVLANVFPGFCIAKSFEEAWNDHFKECNRKQQANVSRYDIHLLERIQGELDVFISKEQKSCEKPE